MTPEQRFLAGHSAHDFEALMDRWRTVAAAANLKETVLAHDDEGNPFVVFETEKPADAESGLYFCAGVHGDEPAGPWGLAEWAGDNVELLAEAGAVIFPCFNPSGLNLNTRADSEGRDLNRLFHDRTVPLLAAWHRFMDGREFRLALHLHEDYDGRGVYLYELTREGEDFGDAVLESVSTIIPRETRTDIDGIEFENAVLIGTEKDLLDRVEEHLEGAWPEAIYVFFHHARYALTFETPSEFSLWDRVQAQRRFLTAAIIAGNR